MPAVWKPPTSVYDPLAKVDDLTDPGALNVIATQLNDETQNQNRQKGALRIKNLEKVITDIVITTVYQGSGTLEIDVSDPDWWLFHRPRDGRPAFIDVDDAGLLIPVDVNFPTGTDRWWRLAQIVPTVDPSQSHQLIFEDLIASLLRDQGGPKHASPTQSRAAFIWSCVQSVPQIRFVCPALLHSPGSVAGDVTETKAEQLQNGVNTTGIVTPSNTKVAKSAQQPDAPPARQNPAKRPGIDRVTSRDGAYWTKGGWRYTKPIDGKSPKLLDILNPPTNVKDQ